MESKKQTKKSCICEDIDEAFSEIEEELEKKLWELYDKMHSEKRYSSL